MDAQKSIGEMAMVLVCINVDNKTATKQLMLHSFYSNTET